MLDYPLDWAMLDEDDDYGDQTSDGSNVPMSWVSLEC